MTLLGTLVAATLMLGGCAASDGYSDDTAGALQSRVLEVTQSAGSDPASALTRLDELDTAASDALARGELTEARHDSIVSAIALVRGDLEAAVAAKAAADAAAQAAADLAARQAADAAADAAKKAAEEARKPGKDNGSDSGKPGKD